MLKKAICLGSCITLALLIAPTYSQTAPVEQATPNANMQPMHPNMNSERREKMHQHHQEMQREHKEMSREEWREKHQRDHVRPEVHTPAGGVAPAGAPAARGDAPMQHYSPAGGGAAPAQ